MCRLRSVCIGPEDVYSDGVRAMCEWPVNAVTAADQLEVAQIFARVATDLASQPDADAVGRRVSEIARTLIGCPWVQVARLTERGTLCFPDPADDTLRAVIRISAEEREGVISETVTGEATILVQDLITEARWPDYTARVLTETNVRSAMSFFLSLGETHLGALAAFSPEAGFFDQNAVDIGSLLAEHAAIALAHASSTSRAHNLEIALMSNRTIGMAIGVLMSRMNVTDQQAFDLLRVTSQNAHCKLREIAEYVTMTGELPPVDELTSLRNTAVTDADADTDTERMTA